MATSARVSGSVGLFCFLLAAGCSNNDGGSFIGGGGTGTNPSGTGSTPSVGSSPGQGGNKPILTVTPDQLTLLARNCGNKVQDPNEQCDDGNREPKDGCTKLCQIEVEWACPTWGQPCVSSVVCGDGKLASTETCDDGNTTDGDGCSADCKVVADGWQCRVPGKRCVPLCGDSKITGTENCDDGNANSGDGCSASCLTEAGYSCDGTPSVCTKSDCGNGIKEAGESCDAGKEKNGLFYGDATGCSKTCTSEPNCRPNGTTQACSTACGDGNKDPGEECDDANALSGDGCSAECKMEAGFTCEDAQLKDTQPCSSGAGNCLVLPIVYRDFEGQNNPTNGHPDFFYMGSTRPDGSKVTCVPNASGHPLPAVNAGECDGNDSTALCLGLAKDTLGANGKPEANTGRAGGLTCACQFTDWDKTGVFATVTDSTVRDCFLGGSGTIKSIRLPSVPVITSADSYSQWYTDSAKSTKVASTLELAQVGTSNQYQFSSSNGRTVYDDIHDIFLRNTNGVLPPGAVTSLTSGFFPLESASGAKLCNLWPYWHTPVTSTCVFKQWDERANNNAGSDVAAVTGVKRNFYFTSEARYLFRYAGDETLSFFGDDDVWVYINGKLVLDLGAPHERLRGTVKLNATGSTATVEAQNVKTGAFIPVGTPQTKTGLGLEVGKTYEIAVFHADRHPRESNYQLTLSGFSTTRTSCTPRCGDNATTAGEECDDGENNKPLADAYNACTTDCKYGPYCGDNEINGNEECDNGVKNGEPYGTVGGCTNSCQKVHYCGDSIIDSAFGEECDGGTGCLSDCTLQVIQF